MQLCGMRRAVALAALVAVSGPARADEATFKVECSKCHVNPAALARKIEGASEQEKRVNLAKFLETHQKSDPATRPELIDYLISLTKEAGPAPAP